MYEKAKAVIVTGKSRIFLDSQQLREWVLINPIAVSVLCRLDAHRFRSDTKQSQGWV